jgi:FAD/FMN-containing dehydrogenase
VRIFRPESEAGLVKWIASSADRFRDEGVPVVTGIGVDRPTGGLDPLPRLSLSTSELSEVISFRPGDLTVTVGAGMRMSALASVVAEAGLWLPIAGMPEDRSVGGWLASAPVGAFDGSYGPVRRHVLACTLLLWLRGHQTGLREPGSTRHRDRRDPPTVAASPSASPVRSGG